MKNFRTLELAIAFYEQTETLEIRGNLRDQLLRASSSISLNLSEGNAKRTEKEKNRYWISGIRGDRYAGYPVCRKWRPQADELRTLVANDFENIGI